MKWKCFPLPDNDPSVRRAVLTNLSVGAYEQYELSRKLMMRFAHADGTAVAIAFEHIDLELSGNLEYRYATYDGGKQFSEVYGVRPIPIGERTTDGLIDFLREYVNRTENGLVVVEDWIRKRSELEAHEFESRLAFCQEDVYHFLKPGDTSMDLIEATFRESWHHWFAGECVAGVVAPNDETWPKNFVDEIVDRTEHIFVPAFDGEGFLVWSPK